jgi:hypothetical protein
MLDFSFPPAFAPVSYRCRQITAEKGEQMPQAAVSFKGTILLEQPMVFKSFFTTSLPT